MIDVESTPVSNTLQDALSPLGQWLVIIAGLGVGIAVVVQTVIWGWSVVRDMIDADGSVRAHNSRNPGGSW